MLMLPQSVKVYIATAPLDMRKSFNGISALVACELQIDVTTGDLFVFLNKRGDKVKVMYWDRNGFCLWQKRLERGVFRLPSVRSKVYKIGVSELTLLLEGIDLTDKQRLRPC
jgi:transposase